MTPQEVFDTVVNGLRAQGGKSEGRHEGAPTCLYRSDNGRKCSAGLLIQDHEYFPWMEGNRIFVILNNEISGHECPTTLRERLFGHIDLVMELQYIHDGSETTVYWEQDFQNIAAKFGLIYTPPSTP